MKARMAPPLVQLREIALTFGGTPLLAGVELSVSAGERVCLVGRNGSGKSTLLKIAAGLVMIGPDRRFLANLSRSTVWLDRGQTRRIERSFAAFEAWRDEVLAEEEREQHKLDRKIVAEEHWLRYGVTARRKRNVRRLGALQALRESRRAYRAAAGKAAISATAADASGKLVIEAERIAKAFDGRPIVPDF